MPNSRDFYKEIFLHVILVRIIVSYHDASLSKIIAKEAVIRRSSVKKVSLKFSQNSQENTITKFTINL